MHKIIVFLALIVLVQSQQQSNIQYVYPGQNPVKAQQRSSNDAVQVLPSSENINYLKSETLDQMINDAGIFDTQEGINLQPKPAKRNFTDSQGNIVDIDEFAPTTGDSQNFDWKLSQKALLTTPSNIVVSPFSVKLLLLLLAEAAGHETKTKKELELVYSNIRKPFAARDMMKNALTSLMAKNEDYQLNFGTKIFVDSFINPGQRYESIAQTHYFTKIERLDFSKAAESTNTINNWCSTITNGYINNLVQQDDVQDSVIVMLNAIYFKGAWRRPFLANETIELPFFVSPTKQIKASFMTQTNNFYYLESTTLNAKLLRIPYKGKKFSMLLVLPNEKVDVTQLISGFNSTALHRAEWLMDEVEVRVSIPKFKTEFKTGMKPILEELGIRTIFTDEASLPLLDRGVGLQHQLRVSNIVQKAGIIIDEQGSTAYAATEAGIVNKFGGDTTVEFNANRPFLFYIQDETTGTLMFAGKITDPTQV